MQMAPMILTLPWGVALIVMPVVGALACYLFRRAAKPLGLMTVTVTALSAAGLALRTTRADSYHHAVGGWGAPLGIELYADGLSVLMLVATAIVACAISFYAARFFDDKEQARFWPLWLLLLTAMNALFLSRDLFNMYVALELTGLAAVALTALTGSQDALSGAIRYLLATMLGSLAYLLGVVFIYHGYGTLDLAMLGQLVESNPVTWLALGLVSAGLALKTALFPLHFWLPPAHASATPPVSAALSALVVKTAFYVLLRFWLEIFPSEGAAPAQLFGLLGCAAVFWGGVQALRARRLKLLIAYSTVMQIGYLFIAFPLGILLAWHGALYLLLSHALAKAAMFLAAGNVLYYGGHDRIADLDHVAQRLPLTVAAFALAGVSIMGLPPSGGFVAKWLLIQASLDTGQWWWTVPILAGSLVAAAYVFKVVGFAFTQAEAPQEAKLVPVSMQWTALVLAVAAIALGLIAPWTLTWLDVGDPFSGAVSR